ncbi:hypothetical protein U0070_006171 [Myodes glareolus]|uniref:Uncharacterized protein n=1 Tax=Myodes glareolus TaxID=447135 RepID=A0AAW0HP17_MYOGA
MPRALDHLITVKSSKLLLSFSCEVAYRDQLRARIGSTPPRKVSLVESMGQEVRPAQADLSDCSLPADAAPLPMQVPLTRAASYPTGVISLYDCVFKRRLDYNQKLHRDDREHAKNLGLHINEEGGIIRNQLQREVSGRSGSSLTVTARGQVLRALPLLGQAGPLLVCVRHFCLLT